jgi:DNA-binding Lrp family transcriptional regulator
MNSKYTLDAADKKILLYLFNNSRSAVSIISKKVHLSREIVNYRMAKLEEEKIITGYIARLNQPLFCAGIALMMCKLTRSDENRFNEIINFVKKSASVNWCIETCGSYDLALTILFDTPKDLANIVTELSNFIGANLKAHEISLYSDEYKFDRTGLITEKSAAEFKKSPLIYSRKSSLNLDVIDAGLLRILANDCRTKNVEISKRLKITEDVVRLRIKSLEKRNIISDYTLSVSEDKLGYEAYQMLMTIENMSDGVINKIKYYTQSNPYIVFCARMSGIHNLVANIHAKNRQHFNKLLQDIRKAIPEISDFEFLLSMQTHKEVIVPEQKIRNTI